MPTEFKTVWIFVTIEVLLFSYSVGIFGYELSIDGPEGKEYRNMLPLHTLATLLIIYLAVDHRRLAKGYFIAFLIVLLLDLRTLARVVKDLTRVNLTAWILNLSSAVLNICSISIILIWYVFIMVKNGERIKYMHF